MRETPTALVAATLAALSIAMPAKADVRVGAWTAGVVADQPPAWCMAMTLSEPEGDALIAVVSKLGVIDFRFASDRLSLTEHQVLTAEFLVDGRSVGLKEVRPQSEQSLGFFGTFAGRLDGSLLQAVEAGERAVIQVAGIRATFDLDGSRQAMQLISLCHAHGAVMPNPVPSSPSAASQSETEEEEEEAQAPTGLGRAMEQFTGTRPTLAQFRCSLTGRDLLGLPNITGRDRPTEAVINVLDDGRAQINGTSLVAMEQKAGSGGLETAIYSARAVFDAMSGAPMERPPVVGLSEEQMDAFAAFQAMGRGMVDEAMGGRERYMVVALAAGMVGFFDLDAQGSPINQTTPLCERTQ